MLLSLDPVNGMAVRRVRLTESWVCGRAGLQPGMAETVESLNLQGTYKEKIVRLGDAFKNFKSLRSLDLSRNIMISLQGIEYLQALRFLNLYYNDISSLEEIQHLRYLSHLKSLDLRLNPVTKLIAEYRPFVIHTLGALEALDDRPVMDCERKGAKYNFRLKEYKTQDMPDKEIGSPVLGEKTSSKSHLDYDTSNTIELRKMNEWKHESPTKYQAEEHQPYIQTQSDFEDEYRPLPSPTRSSLRSPGPASRAKEGQRVTFSDPALSEFTPKREDLAKRLESDDLTSTRKPTSNNPDKPGTAFSYKNTYLTSTPVKKDDPGSERMKADARALDDDRQSSDLRERHMPSSSGEESSRERLLRLSSDLYISTHLNDPPTSLAALRKGFSDVSKTYTLPSKPSLTNTHLPAAKTSAFSRDYKSGWSQDTGSGLRSDIGSTPEPGMKRTSSLNSLLNLKSSSTYLDCHNDDLLSETDLKKRDSLTDEVPSIAGVLQQLMDLVDRYWNGSGSLLQNQRFLVPARDLLSRLRTPHPAKPMSHVGQMRDPRNSPGQEQHDNNMESLKLKMVKIMEENHFLRVKISKLETQATRKEGSGRLTSSPDDLWEKYEALRLEVSSLQQQLTQTSNLQETVHLLHNSHRSLVSTNEYLLGQLKSSSPTAPYMEPRAASPTRLSTNKYLYPESVVRPPQIPSYSPDQAWTPERISLCPL
ncbi:leucine-rich repeat-containing protein 36-like isoform X2 [Mixophyes fleayi]|uniref:leucine-rich repeat-containing protein 36-like isoform X2 n=1 Tax=Mixophyes fleayi TaxID=3061075 RepID=UPI003F4DAC47